jgi:hypothetical protein
MICRFNSLISDDFVLSPHRFDSDLSINYIVSVNRETMRINRQRLRQARLLMQGMWESVFPGSLVVAVSVISNLLYHIVEISGKEEAGSPAVMFTVFLFTLQYIFSPVIYLMFFHPYQEALRRLCGRERAGQANGGLESAKLSRSEARKAAHHTRVVPVQVAVTTSTVANVEV